MGSKNLKREHSKKVLIISQKKSFYKFLELEFCGPKIEKVLTFSQKKKIFLYFVKWNFLKTLLIFEEETFRAQKKKSYKNKNKKIKK